MPQSRAIVEVGRAVSVEALRVFPHHLDIAYLLDGVHRFQTKVFYPAGELPALERRLGADAARRVFCHIAFFEGLKFCATFPETYDVTVLADGLSGAAFEVFREVVAQAWTQHMYENGVSDYWAPEILGKPGSDGASPVAQAPGGGAILCANGGGKDSFLAMKILEEAGYPIAAFQHARSEYGRFDHQHALQSRILPHIQTLQTEHRISVFDDFTDGVFMSAYNPRLRGDCTRGMPCQVGWPEMVFEALPFALLHGYAGFALGNERSADAGQARWPELGREVNHQWLKSNQACALLDRFVRVHLLADFPVFSVLKPIHDHRIYRKLERFPGLLPDFHSCNIIKPWCRKCAKCAYVWLNLVARFGPELLEPIFHANLFDDPDLMPYWRQLMGLEAHNAFECVGEVDETRLAFRRCVERGCTGAAVSLFREAILMRQPPVDWAALADRYDRVHEEHLIPAEIFERIRPFL